MKWSLQIPKRYDEGGTAARTLLVLRDAEINSTLDPLPQTAENFLLDTGEIKSNSSASTGTRAWPPPLRKFVWKDNISRNLEEEMLCFRAFANNMQFLAPKAKRRKSFASSMLLHCLRALLPHQQKIICHFTMKTVWFLVALAVMLGWLCLLLSFRSCFVHLISFYAYNQPPWIRYLTNWVGNGCSWFLRAFCVANLVEI